MITKNNNNSYNSPIVNDSDNFSTMIRVMIKNIKVSTTSSFVSNTESGQ